MKQAPSLVTFKSLAKAELEGPKAQINGKWVPARPFGLFSIWSRLKLAFGVFTGRYDAFQWPEGQ